MKGNKMATYFIAAWSIYLIGGMLLTLRNMGVLEFNFWTTHLLRWRSNGDNYHSICIG